VPGRVLFPKTGFTTDDLVSVYEQLAPVILPHLAARPLTLKRFPTDIHGEAFWEKDAPNFTPSWIRRVPVPRKHENSIIHYISLTTARALRWAASIGCIEIHSFLHRYPYITSPSVIASISTRAPEPISSIAAPSQSKFATGFAAGNFNASQKPPDPKVSRFTFP
jgi:DNA primase